jgi:hypothetical protein
MKPTDAILSDFLRINNPLNTLGLVSKFGYDTYFSEAEQRFF